MAAKTTIKLKDVKPLIALQKQWNKLISKEISIKRGLKVQFKELHTDAQCCPVDFNILTLSEELMWNGVIEVIDFYLMGFEGSSKYPEDRYDILPGYEKSIDKHNEMRVKFNTITEKFYAERSELFPANFTLEQFKEQMAKGFTHTN